MWVSGASIQIRRGLLQTCAYGKFRGGNLALQRGEDVNSLAIRCGFVPEVVE